MASPAPGVASPTEPTRSGAAAPGSKMLKDEAAVLSPQGSRVATPLGSRIATPQAPIDDYCCECED